jgi:hypothetical protein
MKSQAQPLHKAELRAYALAEGFIKVAPNYVDNMPSNPSRIQMQSRTSSKVLSRAVDHFN